MVEYENEQDLGIKYLIFRILHEWRKIFLCGICMALLVGGYRIISGNSEVEIAAQREARSSYEQEYKIYEKRKLTYEQEIERLENTLEAREEYISKSILMQLNPYKVYIAQANVFIQYYDVLSDSAMKEFFISLQGDKNIKFVSNKIGINEENLKEIIDIRPDFENGLIEIKVFSSDKSNAVSILDYLLEGVPISDSVHNKLIIDKSVSMGADLQLAIKQTSMMDLKPALSLEKDTLSDRLLNKQTALSRLIPPEKHYIEFETNIFKYILAGGLFGGLFALLMICFKYYFEDLLNSAEEIEREFGVKIIGRIDVEKSKRVFGFIDNWLYRMEGRMTGIKRSDMLKIIVSRLGESISDIDAGIFILGDADMKNIEAIQLYLEEKFTNLLVNNEATLDDKETSLLDMNKCNYVILIIQCNISRRAKLKKYLQLISDMNKELIGCIVFDG